MKTVAQGVTTITLMKNDYLKLMEIFFFFLV